MSEKSIEEQNETELSREKLLALLMAEEGLQDDEPERFPMSFAQQRLWFFERFSPGGAAYHMPEVLRLRGALDVTALCSTFEAIVARHEVLRTVFVEVNGSPLQQILPQGAWPLTLVDLCDIPIERVENQALEPAEMETRRPFDLAHGPLLRTLLIRLGAEDHLLVVTMHHIVSDGWSMGLFVQEINALYPAFVAGEPSPLPELEIQYADFAEWQQEYLQGETLERQLSYWRGRLQNASPSGLITDFPRPAVQSHEGGVLPFDLPRDLADRLRQLSRTHGATLFMTLLAALDVLLYRYSRQTDWCVGTPVANRTRAELEPLIGFFVNTLAIRVALDGGAPFSQLLDQVKRITLEAYQHQDLPFEKIVEDLALARDLSRAPVFQIMISLENTPRDNALTLAGLHLEPLETETTTSHFDLTLNLCEDDGELFGSFTYADSLFERATVARLAKHYQLLLAGIAAHPEWRLDAYSLLDEEERRLILGVWNVTSAVTPGKQTVSAGFELVAERDPEALAVTTVNRSFTYAAIDTRVELLAAQLRERGVRLGTAVGLCVNRDENLIIGMLAIWKAGGVYVPLDPSYPAERLAFIAEDADLHLIICTTNLIETAHFPSDRAFPIDGPEMNQPAANPTLPTVKLGHDAYMIYTSGSTGRPKGVRVGHRNLSAVLWAGAKRHPIHNDDVMPALASEAFDIALFELLGPLMSGARTLIVARDLVGDPVRLLALIDHATLLHAVPALWRELLDYLDDKQGLPLLRRAYVGGDAVPGMLLDRLAARFPASEIVELYGPTEGTILSASWSLGEAPNRPGNVIGNRMHHACLYILDEHLQVVPVGVPGEICIGGFGVVRGYHRNPERTAECFVPNPFADHGGCRLYRGGDLGRFLPDGRIEFLGRIDHQVKIRGHRVEPGEIEAVLAGAPDVSAVVVLPVEGPGGLQLAAFIQTETSAPASALKAFASKRLPAYMLPNLWVPVEVLPLTINGKVDRAALQRLAFETHPKGSNPVAPHTPTEDLLLDIWCSVLERDGLGIHDNFFEIGGHSLLATRVVSRIRDVFGVALALQTLFAAPTVAELAGQLVVAEESEQDPIEPVPRDGDLPMSFAQQRLWFLDRLIPGSAAYNIPMALYLTGDLKIDALNAAFTALVARHEVLRTVFPDSEHVAIHQPMDWLLPLEDLSGLPESERESYAQSLLAAEAARPFELTRDYPLRTGLVRLNEQEHLLLLTLHHIAADGWSGEVLMTEIASFYNAFARGEEVDPCPPSIQYLDYAVHLRNRLQGRNLERLLDYWRGQLEGTPVLDLVTDQPRGAEPGERGACHYFQIAPALTEALNGLARRHGVTLFMTLSAAFKTLLYRYTGQTDICVGTPIAGRTRAELEPLIGLFVNTLALRTGLHGAMVFSDLLALEKRVTLDAYAHQEAPFEKIVDHLGLARDMSHTPLFQVMLILQNAGGQSPQKMTGLTVTTLETDNNTAKFDLCFTFNASENGLNCGVVFRTELFTRETVARLSGHLENLLAVLVEEPTQTLDQLALLDETERQFLLEPPAETPLPNLFVHTMIAAWSKKAPNTTAVARMGDPGSALTFAMLEDQANRLAHRLAAHGIGPDQRVAVCMRREPALIVAILAVLKAGGAYVPISPDQPPQRLARVLSDTALVLTQDGDLIAPPELERPILFVGHDQNTSTEPFIRPPLHSENLAYVIYTSGSTGEPKGVMLTHGGLANYLHHAVECYRPTSGKGAPLHTAIGFDATITALFPPLVVGRQVVLLPEDGPLSALTRCLHEDWSLIKLTPAHLNALRHVPGFAPTQSKTLFVVGGEDLTGGTLDFWRQAMPNARFINEYGPTEAVVGCSVYQAEQMTYPGSVPIGKPIINTRMLVLDHLMEPTPISVPGDLYIAGAGLARGYLDRPDLTAEKFIPDPHGYTPGNRLYRSGDRARLLGDGNLVFLGRDDHQIKLRGYRIEPGEIETALLGLDWVAEAAVVLYQQRLAAYLVPMPDTNPQTGSIRAQLADRLPEYMIPASFTVLEKLPHTTNGKIDRIALAAHKPKLEQRENYQAPRDGKERVLAAIWAEVLGRPRVGVHDNFFELGGDSILSLQIVSRAARAGLALQVRDVFRHQTVARLAEAGGTLTNGIEAEQGVLTGAFKPAPIQRWFFEQDFCEAHHWNQSQLLRVHESVQVGQIEKALAAILERHDMLRAVYTSDGAVIQPFVTPVFETIDLTAEPAAQRNEAFAREAARIQAGLSLVNGPLIRVALFLLGDGEKRLLFAVHHLAVDGVSWRILSEDFSQALAQIRGGEAVDLGRKTLSYRQWTEALHTRVEAGGFDGELSFWADCLARAEARLIHDFPEGPNRVADTKTINLELDAAQTETLLNKAAALYHTRPDEILLAALAATLTEYTGGVVAIAREGHGREGLGDGYDLSRTVGWFTAVYPVCPRTTGLTDPDALIKSVKEQLRTVPNGGLGFGLLRYLHPDEAVRKRLAMDADVLFNYLGRFEADAPSADGLFTDAAESAGPEHSPNGARPYSLELNGAVINGRLSLSWSYSGGLFQHKTMEDLAGDFETRLQTLLNHCEQCRTVGYTPSDFPLAAVDQTVLDRILAGKPGIEKLYPLSSAQEGMLFHTIYEPESVTYFTQADYAFQGEMDVPAFERAWGLVISRHDILRTTFLWDGLERPLQAVHRHADAPFIHLNWCDEEQDLEGFLAADRKRGFDLEVKPPLRFAWITLPNVDGAPRAHFVWSYHHMLLDAWSVAVIMDEVFQAYAAYKQGENPALPPVTADYGDFIHYLESRDAREDEAFWRCELAGAPVGTPIAARRKQTQGGVRETAAVNRELPPALFELLNSQGRERGLTPNTYLQGAWAMLLSRYNNTDDVLFGVIVSGRPAGLIGVERMVGLFINTLPARVRIIEKMSGGDWLQQIQVQQAELGAREATPLINIQNWCDVPAGQPMFESILVFENTPRAAETGDDSLPEVIDADNFEQTNYPLTLVAGMADTLSLQLAYDVDQFDAATAEQLLEHLTTLLEALVQQPDRSIQRHDPLSHESRRKLLVEWNDTASHFPSLRCLHEWFVLQASRTPDQAALYHNGETFDYAELNARARTIAARLVQRGVAAETPVAICAPRDPRLIAGLLGILMAGGMYVPLDPAYPTERLDFILQDAAAPVLLTTEDLAPRFDGTDVLLLDEGRGNGFTTRTINALNPAYVIYTSGSTGRPKGVVISHRNAGALVHWAGRVFPAENLDGVFASTSICFDLSVFEIFVPLSFGGRIVLGDNALSLAEIPAEAAVSLINTVPSAAETLLREGWLPRSVHTVNLAGEPLRQELVERLYQFGVKRVYDLYGPSEDTTYSTFTLRESGGSANIGGPIGNTRAYLLDTYMRPTPEGAPGEIHLAGEGVARGYLGRPELTAERFIPDPFAAEPGKRLYRTGDLGRYREDGRIVYLGRTDHQVKVRGFRVEPGEIESLLEQIDGVREAAVLAPYGADGTRRLVAYLAGGASDLDPAAVLRDQLPVHMVPERFLQLDELPRTPNGKLDRRALEARLAEDLSDSGSAGAEEQTPATPTLEILTAVWAEVLGLERAGATDNFFQLGGHSLSAAKIVSRVRHALGREMTPRDLFEAPTPTALAERLEQNNDGGLQAPPIVPVPRDGRALALSFPQEQLWTAQSLNPGSAAFNIYNALTVTGPLDAAVMERAFNEVIRRHEILRTTFAERDGKPEILIHSERSISLMVEDLRGQAEPAAAARDKALDLARRPFDLASEIPLRPALYRLDDQTHLLAYTLHHIAGDAWSLGLLSAEISALYEAFSRNTEPLLPQLPLQYADFAWWQRRWMAGETLRAHLDYWHRKLGGDQPITALPLDRPRTDQGAGEGAAMEAIIPAELTAALKALCRKHQVTLYMGLLAAFLVALQRYERQDDIALGMAVAGRDRLETEHLIGCLLNMVVLRFDLKDKAVFPDLLDHVRRTALEAYAYQGLPFETLLKSFNLKRRPGVHPFFQVAFGMQNVPQQAETESDGLHFEETPLEKNNARYDLTIWLGEQGETLSGTWTYNKDLFNEGTVKSMIDWYHHVLETVTAHTSENVADLLARAGSRAVAAQPNKLAKSLGDLPRGRKRTRTKIS